MITLTASSGLAILGMVRNLVGVVLLFLYGMPFKTRRSGPALLIRHKNAAEERDEKLHDKMGWIGLLTITFGTVFQIIAVLLHDREHFSSRHRVYINTQRRARRRMPEDARDRCKVHA